MKIKAILAYFLIGILVRVTLKNYVAIFWIYLYSMLFISILGVLVYGLFIRDLLTNSNVKDFLGKFKKEKKKEKKVL